MNVNLNLITFRPGLIYFLMFGAFGSATPFMVVMYAAKGLDPFQIGVVQAVRPLVTMLASVLFGLLIDGIGTSFAKKLTMLFCTSISGALVLFLPYANTFLAVLALMGVVHSAIRSPLTSIVDATTMQALQLRQEDANEREVEVECEREHDCECEDECKCERERDVNATGKSKGYGAARLWGAVSWGIIALTMGGIVTVQETCGLTQERAWMVGLFSYCALLIATGVAFLVSTLPLGPKESPLRVDIVELQSVVGSAEYGNGQDDDADDDEQRLPLDNDQQLPVDNDNDKLHVFDEPKATMLQSLAQLFGSRRYLFFLSSMLLMGIGANTISNFLFLYLDELGAPDVLLGLTLLVMVSTEIAFFIVSDRVIASIGTEACILSAMLAFVVRVVAYSFVTNPWFVLPFEALHGLTFAAGWAAGVEQSARSAPETLKNSAQSIFSSVYMGAGNFIAAFFGGLIYRTYSAPVLFRSVAVLLGATTAVYIAVERVALAQAWRISADYMQRKLSSRQANERVDDEGQVGLLVSDEDEGDDLSH
jgi:MFS_1 like family